MLLPFAATVLLLAAGQSDDARDRSTAEGDVAPSGEDTSTGDTRQARPSEDFVGPRGVPFMPSVGVPADTTRGVFLDVALLSQVRARTLTVTDAGTTWGFDLEVTPGIALEVASPSFTLSVGYAPRFTIPFNVGEFELAVLNRATLRAVWRADELWHLTALGIFLVGDYSQLVPASTPGGSGPPPPVLNPIRSFQTYPYVGIDTLLRVEGTLSARTRIRLAGGYFDVGGVGAVGEANQPRTWGPQAEGSFDWDLSRTATLTTTAAARDWIQSGGYSTLLGTVVEGWRQSWTSELETTLSAGVGLSNRNVESQSAAGHWVPVASARLDYRQESRQPISLSVDVSLAPFFDQYAGIAYQRIVFGGTIDWRPSDAWRVGAALSAALVPYTVRAPESYGTAGLSASFAPVKLLVVSAGAFSQVQFQGPSTPVAEAFRQWTAYLSLAFLDRFSL